MSDTAVKTLPDGRTVRLGDTVTGSYWQTRDVVGPVVGWKTGSTHIQAAGHGFIDLPDENVDDVTAGQYLP